MSAGLPELSHNEPVEAALRDRITQDGPIHFADFMDISLYGENGYYSGGHTVIGSDIHNSDFVTSPEVSPVFGATIGNFIAETWDAQGSPDNFQVIEMGAGNGTMARDILNHIKLTRPYFFRIMGYTILERAESLISTQQETLAQYHDPDAENLVNWVHGNAYDVPFGNIEKGLIISNELVDAFPAHRLIRRDGMVKEIYVGLDDKNNFCEVEGELSLGSVDPLFLRSIQEGREQTFSPLAQKWMQTVGMAMRSGRVLTIDYGQDSDPKNRRARIFTKVNRDADIGLALQFPGSVDITTSVDFDQLIKTGQEAGLSPLEVSTQRDFLHRYGFYDEILRYARADAEQHKTPDKRVSSFTSEPYEDMYTLDGSGLGGYSVLVQEK